MWDSLPEARPGEALYSVLARQAFYLNAVEAGPFAEVLFGRRHAIASFDLPGGLSALVRDLAAAERERTIDAIIDELTAFPFHTAFVAPEVRASVRAAMRGDVTGVHLRLGLATFTVRPLERLRFCPECLDAMHEDRGDACWRRDHQLPGISVCAVHGVPLKVSDVVIGDLGRHSFVPASREVCRGDAIAAVRAEGDALARLARLAGAAADLLNAPPPARCPKETVGLYRDRIADVGLMRSPRRVDHRRLASAFREVWGDVPELVPGLELGGDAERSWIADLVRGGRRAAHPLQHLLLIGMLDAMEGGRAIRPFGSGPWICRNPLAAHHGGAVIPDVRLRRDRGAIYGDFACSCGYLYTIGISADGMAGAPKYRRFGPLFAPALRAALERGDGLRPTATAFGIDPKTLLREAAIAGIEVPWSTTPSGRVPVTSTKTPAFSKSPKSVGRVPARGRARRNWFAIDARLSRSVKRAAVEVLAERPPVRVTASELERRVAKPDWIVKRTSKLPMTVTAMSGAVEHVDQFRRRRLDWWVDKAVAAGDLRPCEVLRAAGLPTGWLPEVRDALGTAMDAGRQVA